MSDKKLREAVLVKCATLRNLTEVAVEAQILYSIRQEPISSSNIHKVSNQSVRSFQRRKPFHGNLNGKQHFRAPEAKKPTCYRCGNSSHLAPECHHRNSRCSLCNKIGHLRVACRGTPKKINFLREETFHAIDSRSGRAPVNITLQIEGYPVTMEVDTGTALSTISLNNFNKLFKNSRLLPNDVRLRPADGDSIEPIGYAELDVKYQNVGKKLRLYVIDRQHFPSLVGREWLAALPVRWHELFNSNGWNLSGSESSGSPSHHMASKKVHHIKEQNMENAAKNLLQKYKNLTKPGLGCIPSTEAKLELMSDNPKPIFVRARPIAHAITDMTEKELEFLEENGVIEKLNASEWAHPLVVVPRAKGKKVRLCGDFKSGINRFIKTDEHPLKNIRHALDNIGNGVKFSKLDILSAFLHMPVRESDRKYLVVNTHRGLYQFNRMSNGLCSAPAIWQRFIEGVLAGINGVECVMDDIIVTGKTDQEHLERLEEVLSRLNDQDIRLNVEKCQFFQESVTYCGFVLKHQQIHKCDDKVQAIKEAPSPKTVGELKAFLGLIQFYAGFAPRLADLANPMYRLLKADASFIWSKEMSESFAAVKRELCSDRVIVPFDPKKPVLLATDASPTGISAVLSHRFPDGSERPIAYYSRALTDTERKYSQIDKEALGIRTGVEKFFYYVFGRKFTLISDSRPLVQIFSPQRSLPPLSATRMQHYAIYLMGFTFDIIYRRTDKHQNADALSRLPANSKDFHTEDGIESFLVNQLQEVPLNFKAIAKESGRCKELRPLFSDLRRQVNSYMSPRYFGIDSCEFSLYEDAIILRGHRVVVPKTCRKNILVELHEGHYGERKMKELARRYVWWPDIDKDIKNVVLSCNACLEHARNPPKEILHAWHPCQTPFERIHLDYAGPIDGKYVLLIVDAYSKWLEAFITQGKTSKETLRHIRETVSRFGLPKVMVTDNDPTFASDLMRNFCENNGIRLMHSPAYHPASNGQAERFVATLKNALKKLSTEGGDIHTNLCRFLFRQRMVSSSTGESPSSRMIGRELRSRLDLLQEVPRISDRADEKAKFRVGDPVIVRDYRSRKPKWIAGKVVKNHGTRICR
ncbi:uncharacterized protein K02A2.6-like, partial [Galendromus occidentalis]|uniref:RNA-directed DNA polymerase n=1 Tax=Galendromus occidentalis TaxID=34638 RepID=A0AAJ7WJ75_9ACAR